MERILTIEVEITDPEKASWIWDNHSGKDIGNGVYIRKIRNGEMPEDED